MLAWVNNSKFMNLSSEGLAIFWAAVVLGLVVILVQLFFNRDFNGNFEVGWLCSILAITNQNLQVFYLMRTNCRGFIGWRGHSDDGSI